MTHDKKIEYMKIACGIVGFGFEPKGLDMLVSLYELVIEKQGKTDLEDVCKAQDNVNKRAEIKSKREFLDKVSEAKK